jgi:hypothetical protein
MVGSYGPDKHLKSHHTPETQAPSGMLARGSYMYTLKSLFADDDDNENLILKWEWTLDIKKQCKHG